MIQLFIVDDHPLITEGLKSLLNDCEDICVVGTASNAIDALDALKNQHFCGSCRQYLRVGDELESVEKRTCST